MSGTALSASRDVHYGYFFVAYIDLLGQQNELMKLVSVPHSPGDPAHRAAVIDILRNSAGRVKAIRDAFTNFFQSAGGTSLINQIPAPRRQEYRAFRASTVRQIGFSDSFIISVPLAEDRFGSAKNLANVWSALIAIAGISVLALASSTPLRGGVDVERGVDLFENEVYGPALIHAYRLESKVASYPRTVVGDGLLDYLRTERARPVRLADWDRFAIEQAGRCESLICRAPDDGHAMVHMLAPEVLALSEIATLVPQASNWVQQEVGRHAGLGNPGLADRYSKLTRYFKEHGYA